MKLRVVVLVILLVFLTGFFVLNKTSNPKEGATAFAKSAENTYSEEVNFEKEIPLLIEESKAYEQLKETSKVYEELLSSSKAYNEFIKTQQGSGHAAVEGKISNSNREEAAVTPKWYQYIPISGSLGSQDLIRYGKYLNYDWMSVTINWTPKAIPVTLVIYDITTETEVTNYTSSNGTITISSNLDPSHGYEVWIFNCSSKETISYSGQISLSSVSTKLISQIP